VRDPQHVNEERGTPGQQRKDTRGPHVEIRESAYQAGAMAAWTESRHSMAVATSPTAKSASVLAGNICGIATK